MWYCAQCEVKNCAKKMGQEGAYPKQCPTLLPEQDLYMEKYHEPLNRLMAQVSGKVSPDHGECRVLKTIHFAKECGFKKIGLAFCITLKDSAKVLCRLLQDEGFEVESIICKVGHKDRSEIGAPASCKAMCNPIAQAELLNEAKTDFNILVGLCVGHDSLFIRHSKAPVTVLIAKDHVFDNAPERFLKDLPGYGKPEDIGT